MPIEKLRLENRPSGIIGAGERRSWRRNSTPATTPTAIEPRTTLSHPRTGCSVSPKTGPARATTPSAAPSQSIRAGAGMSADGGTPRAISHSVVRTTGTLTAKISRQDAASISTPPSSGPSTPAIAPKAVQVPIARPRSSSGKTWVMIASVLGVSRAANTPWTARKTHSTAIEGATAHSSEATPKPTTPMKKTRRCPKMSPSEPPISSSADSVRR